MQFTTTILAALSATAALAAPADAAKDPQLIDLWQDRGFLGLKFTGSSTVGTCVNLPRDFTNNVSSCKAKPTFRCTIWVEKNCLGTGFSFNEQGDASLPDWIDNKSKSWKCVTN